jgi:hypothetical protein
MTDKRRGGDRRRLPRGGRRLGDIRGYTPLVMVVDPEARRRDISEGILAKLMFAVAPVESAEKAVSIMRALHPEVIIAGDEDAGKLRELMGPDAEIEIIALGEETRLTDKLIEEVRSALRQRSKP